MSVLAQPSTFHEPLYSLDEIELLVAEHLGRLIRFWGFGPHAGRVWALLFLSPHALAAADVAKRLKMSAGNLSQTLGLLQRWGVIRRFRAPGRKRFLIVENGDVWSSVTRVLRERELAMVGDLDVLLTDLIADVGRVNDSGDETGRARYMRARLLSLQRLTRAGQALLTALLAAGRFDIGHLRDLMRLVRGGKR